MARTQHGRRVKEERSAGGVVFRRTEEGTRLLLILDAYENWGLPKGHIEPSESPKQAALREVREETGIVGIPLQDGIFDVDVHAIPPSGDRPAHTHFDIRYLLEATNVDLVDSEEVLGVRWVPLQQVSALVTDRSVLRATGRLLADR